MLTSTQLLKNKTTRLFMGAATVALMIGIPQASAYAQDAGTAELVVTAQKREQKLKDVPIVVTTVSGKLLQAAGVRDIKDLQILTPGLTVTSTSNEAVTTARIRGVGTVGDNPGLESSVGIVIDGVYRSRNGVGFGDLGEMERIEVLKGPQGTLFGKNTSAGVINIITKAPSFKFGFDGELTAGNFGARGVAASLTGPIIEGQLAGRLYVASRKRDGFYNVNTGVGPRSAKEDQTQDFQTIRGQLLATPNSDFSLRVIADYSKRNERCCVAVQIRTGPTSALVNGVAGGQGVMTTANPTARTAYSNRDTVQNIRDGGFSVEGNLNIENVGKLTFVTAGRDWKSVNGQDIDYTGADILYRDSNGDFDARFKNFSQEVRLAGSTDHLNWLVGAFYTTEQLDRHDSYVMGTAYETYLGLLMSNPVGTVPTRVSQLTGRPFGTNFPGNSVAARDHYVQDSTSLAFFTNNTLKVTDALELTLGLRYTSESKKLNANYTNPNGGLACKQARVLAGLGVYGALAPTVLGTLCLPWSNNLFDGRVLNQSEKDSKVSGTLKAAYHWNDDVMTYASYAKGYKGGGFNLDRSQTGVTPDNDLSFGAETVDSYELGIKSSLFNNKMMLNLTVYDQTFDSFQLNTFLGTTFVVESIPSVKAKGIDADIYWTTPIKGLSFQGGATFSTTKYSMFNASGLGNVSRFPGLSLLPGHDISFSPRTTASAALTWGGMMGELRGSWNISAKYSSSYNTGSDLIPFKMQNAYTLLNARIGIGAANQAWTLELWGQNLSDVEYKQVVFNGPLQGAGFQTTLQSGGSNPGTYYNKALDSNTYDAFLGQPRTYGMTLRVKY